MRIIIHVVMTIIFFTPLSNAQPTTHDTNMNKVIEFLKVACVATGKLQVLKVEGGAKFKLRNIFSSGAETSVSFTRQELEGFADATSKLNAQQASEMRECMKPHINKIIGKMIGVNAGKQTDSAQSSISTDDQYFDVKEFNNVLAAYAESPDQQFFNRNIKSNLESKFNLKMSKTKIAHYSNIAYKKQYLNKFEEPCENEKAYKITGKGLNYVLQQGLLD